MIGSVTGGAFRVKIRENNFPNIGRSLHFRRDQTVPYSLYFWNQPASFSLPHAHIAQELQYGNDVEGLIDLPVKEIIDRLKAEIPSAVENAGVLTANTECGSFKASWSWQFVKLDCHDLPEETRLRLCEIMQEFSAHAYDPQLNLRHP